MLDVARSAGTFDKGSGIAPRGYSWPPFEKGHQLSRKHGTWAADVSEEAKEVLTWLYDPADVERYPAMAVIGAEIVVRLRRAKADIAERGTELEDGREHPLLKYVDRWERQLFDLSSRFGLDPRSDAALSRERAEATRSVVDLDALYEAGRETIEVEGEG